MLSFRYTKQTSKNVRTEPLNISDFSLYFLVKMAIPPEKSYPLFSSNPPLKVEVLSSPPFWKFGRRFKLPAERGQEGRGTHIMRRITKAKEAPFPHEVTLALLDTNPVFWCTILMHDFEVQFRNTFISWKKVLTRK